MKSGGCDGFEAKMKDSVNKELVSDDERAEAYEALFELSDASKKRSVSFAI